MKPEPIGIYIIEDDTTILESFKSIIETETGFKYSGGANTAEEGIEELNHIIPDVLLLDITLPKMSGLEAIPLIKKLQPDLNILMLTVHEDTDTVFSALRNGAVGYLLKGYSIRNKRSNKWRRSYQSIHSQINNKYIQSRKHPRLISKRNASLRKIRQWQ